MSSFKWIASLVKHYRGKSVSPETGKALSQTELSLALGYSNGQFVSNVERGLCSIPLGKLKLLGLTLSIPEEEIKEALLNDYREDIELGLALGGHGVQVDTGTESVGRHLN